MTTRVVSSRAHLLCCGLQFYDAILKRAGELIDQQASISKSNKYCKRL